MDDLYRWRLHVQAERPERLRARNLRTLVCRLAEEEGCHHDHVKPFTVTPLHALSTGLAIDITTIGESTAARLVERVRERHRVPSSALLPELGRKVGARMAPDVPLTLEEITSHEALLQQALPAPSRTLHFLQPVTFSSCTLPTAQRVYGHLRAHWDTFAPQDLRFRLDLAGIGASDASLSTVQIEDGHSTEHGYVDRPHVGCCGWITHDLSSRSRRDQRLIGALATYATFVGVGAGTRIGMGVVRDEGYRQASPGSPTVAGIGA